jgi:glycosyltransferase involved in cell wall biosynthesis
MSISIALATKDGARYLEEQVLSILPQLHSGDELIISVDPSCDGTRELAARLAAGAPSDTPSDAERAADVFENASCIRVVDGPGEGVIKNFEHALKATRNEKIFLCDHDDVWMPHKVAEVLRAFVQSNAVLVIHDAEVVDQDLAPIAPSYFQLRNSGSGYRKNLLKNTYIGACMAFMRELKQLALPFPSTIPMHDQWLGLLAERHGGTYFLEEPLIKYRRHESNATADNHASFNQMFTWRKNLIQALTQRERKIDE